MIKNYIKLALRGLQRNKFFSAISLFGISFTMGILMLIVSMLETEVGATAPLTEKDRMVLIHTLTLEKKFYDTIYAYDTSYVAGLPVVDTSFTLNDAGSNNSNNQYAWSFLDRHFSDIPSAENHTFFSLGSIFNAYVNNSKVEMRTGYVDAGFWEVLDFEFTDGYPFKQEAIDQEAKVAVITTDLAERYFGRTTGLIGEEIYLDGMTIKVVGIVKPAGVSIVATDVFIPHTLDEPIPRHEEQGSGGYRAIILAAEGISAQRVKDDIESINATLEVPPSVADRYNTILTKNDTYHEIYADRILDQDEPEDSLRYMKYILFGVLGFFIILPTINLINLNVSRIMERSSEIGVRKAFGATQSNILAQFIIENIVQTLIGSVIGLGIALLLIKLLNDAQVLGDIILKINYRFFVYSFLIALLFGVVSGLLPAWRMSRVHIINALKQYKL